MKEEGNRLIIEFASNNLINFTEVGFYIFTTTYKMFDRVVMLPKDGPYDGNMGFDLGSTKFGSERLH